MNDIKAKEVALPKGVADQIAKLSAAQILANPPKLKTLPLTEEELELAAPRQPEKAV